MILSNETVACDTSGQDSLTVESRGENHFGGQTLTNSEHLAQFNTFIKIDNGRRVIFNYTVRDDDRAWQSDTSLFRLFNGFL